MSSVIDGENLKKNWLWQNKVCINREMESRWVENIPGRQNLICLNDSHSFYLK